MSKDPALAAGDDSTTWTSRRRLLTALACGQPDRVPVSTYELVGCDSRAWENREPSYKRLMDRIRADTDCIAMWSPASDGREMASAAVAPADQQVETHGHITRTTRVLHTPGGDLRQVTEVDDRVHTTWIVEHYCKNIDDVDKALSVPYAPVTYDFSDLRRIGAEVGDRGAIMDNIADPALLVAELMSFQDFVMWAFEDTAHFARSVELMAERVMENLRRRLAAGVADMVRIYGPEYFTPPYLPPEMFRRFVLPHVTQMTRMFQARGCKVRLHSHGKIAKVLDMILDTGCDGLDPCEPPPDGDIDLADLKRRCMARKVSVFGNIEIKLLEAGSPKQVRAAVRSAMEQAKEGGGFVLMPTAAPIDVPLSPRTEENYFAYIEAGMEFGNY